MIANWLVIYTIRSTRTSVDGCTEPEPQRDRDREASQEKSGAKLVSCVPKKYRPSDRGRREGGDGISVYNRIGKMEWLSETEEIMEKKDWKNWLLGGETSIREQRGKENYHETLKKRKKKEDWKMDKNRIKKEPPRVGRRNGTGDYVWEHRWRQRGGSHT